MGNCQAGEAATVLIQHPNGASMKFYHSLSASHVMASNPGHYVAIIITSQPIPNPSSAAAPVKQLRLLRPADKLHIGQIYRLISFQVLSELASKKKVRLSKMILGCEEKRMSDQSRGGGDRAAESGRISLPAKAAEDYEKQCGGGTALLLRPAPWRPALESIREIEQS
ncbi:uncharacterized protein LOC110034859 isoform X2 [Phalaenopsis equestris]|uniref:uncharacterized protein LOC110034859 isoform X2 n=1 Tax=Phalaenopsis equestris TaxID=78828 RepID=UPI0009E28BF3|nr:uncharacterized protein LOC110034859 isoform X2 [Phalaenopsis equestris]